MPSIKVILRALGLLVDTGQWLEEGRVLACAYPRRERAFSALRMHGVSMLVNLHERAHDPVRLQRYGLTEIHLPVKDFTAPSPEQLHRGVTAIEEAVSEGKKVAVHCGGGIGRTGTLLACYLVSQGMTTVDAIARVRSFRPGSIETRNQVNAVMAYGQFRRA
jgi:atypical dual specificity phosphatase